MQEPPAPVRLLLVEDDPADARLFTEALEGAGGGFHITHAPRLTLALELLGAQLFDVLVLDLFLPDSSGLDTFQAARDRAPELAVVIVTGLDDEGAALHAVKAGAQEYLVKGDVSGKVLARVLRSAVERQNAQAAVRQLAMLDELTGLLNRRGFLVLAEQQRKIARRSGRHSLLVFADLDGLKGINDGLGHDKGDLALVETAHVLKACFRESDILARLGGDEFAVLAIDAEESDAPAIAARLERAVRRKNERVGRQFELSLSVGVVPLAAGDEAPMERALAGADAAMYEVKKARKQDRTSRGGA
jgi:diguanylate cyclase (GGDEF)-like protein